MSWGKLRKQLTPLLAIIGLAAIATVVGGYILRHERLRLPFDDIYTVKAELPTGQALTPGQGQSVTVAGVKVGEISKVELRDGRALVSLGIERDKLPDGIRSDATLLVRPRTPLQDMTIDVDPGRARKKLGDDVLPVDRSTPSINLDEVLAALDTDTRAWATTLVGGLGKGVGDKGEALRAAFKASAPTLEATRRLAGATAERRRELARAIASLRSLTDAVAKQDSSLASLVDSGNATFGVLAAEQDALRAGLAKLPPTLEEAGAALQATRPFARGAAPALRDLIPSAQQLPSTLRKLDPLVREGLPGINELRRTSRALRSPARDLRRAANSLTTVSPDLVRSFDRLRYTTNMLAFNPPGQEEGYMHWLGWFLHNGQSLFSGQDGNGAFWRGGVIVSCSALANVGVVTELTKLLFSQVDICPAIPGNP